MTSIYINFVSKHDSPVWMIENRYSLYFLFSWSKLNLHLHPNQLHDYKRTSISQNEKSGLRYLCRFNRCLFFFNETLRRAAREFISISMMFSVVFFAFPYVLSNAHLQSCSSSLQTAKVFFEMTLMKFDTRMRQQSFDPTGHFPRREDLLFDFIFSWTSCKEQKEPHWSILHFSLLAAILSINYFIIIYTLFVFFSINYFNHVRREHFWFNEHLELREELQTVA